MVSVLSESHWVVHLPVSTGDHILDYGYANVKLGIGTYDFVVSHATSCRHAFLASTPARIITEMFKEKFWLGREHKLICLLKYPGQLYRNFCEPRQSCENFFLNRGLFYIS